MLCSIVYIHNSLSHLPLPTAPTLTVLVKIETLSFISYPLILYFFQDLIIYKPSSVIAFPNIYCGQGAEPPLNLLLTLHSSHPCIPDCLVEWCIPRNTILWWVFWLHRIYPLYHAPFPEPFYPFPHSQS